MIRLQILDEHHGEIFRMFPDLRGPVKVWCAAHLSTKHTEFEFVSYYIPLKPDQFEARMEYAIGFVTEADAMLFRLKWL